MNYQYSKTPETESKISINSEFSLDVPDRPITPFIEGNGIESDTENVTGVDITPVMYKVTDAAVAKACGRNKEIQWMKTFASIMILNNVKNPLNESMKETQVVRNQSDDRDSDQDIGLAVQESRPEVAEPKRYMVILVNDDFTPMEFVVLVLREFFNLDEEAATRIMLNVHTKGKGVCGIYSKDIAETKVVMVNEFARENEHPLLCTMEQA